MKLKAFTLAEVLICLMIIGALAIIMVQNVKTKDFTEKGYIANAFKAMEAVQQASVKIRDIENTACPTGSFMVEVVDDWEYALVNSSGSNANTAEVLDLYSNYIKFEDSGFKFCDHTGYCSDNDDILGAKLAGGIYLGFEVTAIGDCPDYYMPNTAEMLSAKGKCWGNLYIDVDGEKGPNQLGKDVFVIGLNESGLAY